MLQELNYDRGDVRTSCAPVIGFGARLPIPKMVGHHAHHQHHDLTGSYFARQSRSPSVLVRLSV